LRNDIVFASILFTEIFDKAFEVWLLQLHEPKYFMNYMIICFQLFSHVEMICEIKEDDYENKIMILREACYCILLINENKR
jgi:hypothetical protein